MIIEGWTAEDAALELAELKKAHKTGTGPVRMSEKRERAKEKKKAKEAQKKKEAREAITFSEFFENNYFPIAKSNKKAESYRKENEHFENWLNPVLGSMAIKKIYPLHLEGIKKNMIDSGKSPRTIEYVFATYRQVRVADTAIPVSQTGSHGRHDAPVGQCHVFDGDGGQ